MKRTNLRIIETEEGEETQVNIQKVFSIKHKNYLMQQRM